MSGWEIKYISEHHSPVLFCNFLTMFVDLFSSKHPEEVCSFLLFFHGLVEPEKIGATYLRKTFKYP